MNVTKTLIRSAVRYVRARESMLDAPRDDKGYIPEATMARYERATRVLTDLPGNPDPADVIEAIAKAAQISSGAVMVLARGSKKADVVVETLERRRRTFLAGPIGRSINVVN